MTAATFAVPAFAADSEAVFKLKKAYTVLRAREAAKPGALSQDKISALRAIRAAIEANKPLDAQQQELVAKGFPEEYTTGIEVSFKTLSVSRESVPALDRELTAAVRDEGIPRPQDTPDALLRNIKTGRTRSVTAFEASIMLGTLINSGAQVWSMVQENKVIVGPSNFANALPPNTDWNKCTGWPKVPTTIETEQKVTNMFGTMIEAKYVFKYYFAGSCADDKGKYKGRYIANFTAYPTYFYAAKGYGLTLNVSVGTPMNVGTPEKPIASLPVTVSYATRTWLTSLNSSDSYIINGDDGKMLKN
jgi:hypothetical protein